jgi:HSP20 family protein
MPSETIGRISHRPPRADVYLTQDAVLVELEVPGFATDELVVVASERGVTVSGDRSSGMQDRHYLLRERGPAEFRREFRLPAGMDADNLTFDVVDGVLTVRVPLVEPLPSDRVEVTPMRYRVNADSAVD